jgi:hypothetical protein
MSRDAGGPQRGLGSCAVAHGGRACWAISCKPCPKKSSIEAITLTDRIQRSYNEWPNPLLLLPTLHQRTSRPTLNDDQRNAVCQCAKPFFEGRCIGDAQQFIFIRKDYVHRVQQQVENASPRFSWIIIRIH